MLQQEQAKAFFANYDSKRLYNLIMDGTPISITKEDYQEAKNMSVEFKVKLRIILQGTEVWMGKHIKFNFRFSFTKLCLVL